MKFHDIHRARVSLDSNLQVSTQNDAQKKRTMSLQSMYEHVSKPVCEKLDLILAEMKKQTSMVAQTGYEQTAIVEVGQKRPRHSDSEPELEPEPEPEPERLYDIVSDDEEEDQQEAKSAETFATDTLATLRAYSIDERNQFFTKFISELTVAECRVVRERIAERPSVTCSPMEFRYGDRVWFKCTTRNNVRLSGTVIKSSWMKKNLLIRTDCTENQTTAMGGGMRWIVPAAHVYRERE